MTYKICINDSIYSEYIWYYEHSMIPVENDKIWINPLEYKLFNGDVINEANEIIYSPLRQNDTIPGILLFIGKTYGRAKNGKLIYKCVPNDIRIPAFLVPFEQKHVGFNKNITNKFVLFKYIEWTDKHPVGIISNTIGNINDLSSFYEYQLCCKNLHISIKDFTNTVNKCMKKQANSYLIDSIMQRNMNIENRLNYNVFTIDPKFSTDLDDGIGIKDNNLSIYIANVPLLIEHFGLWGSFSERISTIYLPNRKIQMLPSLLSENLCSLLENESRFAFCMDIVIDKSESNIVDIKFRNTLIKVRKNYRYDDIEEYQYTDDYQKIMRISRALCKNYGYIKEIKDSHDLIAFLMILMNNESAKKMASFKDGIYRTLKIKESHKNNSLDHLSNEILNFIKIWQSSSGQYADYNSKDSHDLIGDGIESYVHITSPIRRLVDLLNMIKLQDLLHLAIMSPLANEFYSKWIGKLEYINTTMRAIRKVQIDCNILSLCVNTPSILDDIYDGYVFDKIDCANQYLQYTVYIPKIKIILRVNVRMELEEYSCLKFKLYLIEDGITLKRKIRAEIISH